MDKKPGNKDSKFQKPKPNIVKRNIDNAKYARSKSKEVLKDKDQNRTRTTSQNSKSKAKIQNLKKTGQTKPPEKKIASQNDFDSMKSPVLVDKISQPKNQNSNTNLAPEAKNPIARVEKNLKTEEISKVEEIPKVNEIAKVEETTKIKEFLTDNIDNVPDISIKAVETVGNSGMETVSSEESTPYAKSETPLKIGKVKPSEVVLSSLKRRRNSKDVSETMEKSSKKSL